jgi:hypothetical protein
MRLIHIFTVLLLKNTTSTPIFGVFCPFLGRSKLLAGELTRHSSSGESSTTSTASSPCTVHIYGFFGLIRHFYDEIILVFLKRSLFFLFLTEVNEMVAVAAQYVTAV